jgi:hypothetical protein
MKPPQPKHDAVALVSTQSGASAGPSSDVVRVLDRMDVGADLLLGQVGEEVAAREYPDEHQLHVDDDAVQVVATGHAPDRGAGLIAAPR